MNIQEAKNIRLIDFLAGLGHTPIKQNGNSVWYKLPRADALYVCPFQ